MYFKNNCPQCHVVAIKHDKQTLINSWKYPHTPEAADVYTDQAGL